MAVRASRGAALLTPSLLGPTARLHADLAAVMERSRDLLWWGRQRRQSAAFRVRPIRGAAGQADDATVIAALILERPMCPDCITTKSGLSAAEAEAVIQRIAAVMAIHREVTRCRTCGVTVGVVSIGPPPEDTGPRVEAVLVTI